MKPRRVNVDRMRRSVHRDDFRRWDAELREAGATPLVAREIVEQVAHQCPTWGDLARVMPSVIVNAREYGVRNTA
jgi:hypothetical protein